MRPQHGFDPFRPPPTQSQPPSTILPPLQSFFAVPMPFHPSSSPSPSPPLQYQHQQHSRSSSSSPSSSSTHRLEINNLINSDNDQQQHFQPEQQAKKSASAPPHQSSWLKSRAEASPLQISSQSSAFSRLVSPHSTPPTPTSTMPSTISTPLSAPPTPTPTPTIPLSVLLHSLREFTANLQITGIYDARQNPLPSFLAQLCQLIVYEMSPTYCKELVKNSSLVSRLELNDAQFQVTEMWLCLLQCALEYSCLEEVVTKMNVFPYIVEIVLLSQNERLLFLFHHYLQSYNMKYNSMRTTMNISQLINIDESNKLFLYLAVQCNITDGILDTLHSIQTNNAPNVQVLTQILYSIAKMVATASLNSSLLQNELNTKYAWKYFVVSKLNLRL